MNPPIRLTVTPGADPQTVRLSLTFAAPENCQPTRPAEAWLEFGDGQITTLGVLTAPTAATWHAAHTLLLAEHIYAGLGPYTARLLWGGSMLLDAGVSPGALPNPPAECPPGLAVTTFAVESQPGRAFERSVRCQLTMQDCTSPRYVRLDSGTGQAAWLIGADVQQWEQRLVYAKSGTYTLALDLLDAEGFWLCSLAERSVEVAFDERSTSLPAVTSTASQAYLPSGDQPVGSESSQPATGATPWLPGRYVRPLWGWVRTYTSPSGNAVERVLALGTYLSIRGETVVGTGLWYQTANHDWISASHVADVQPSTLAGTELGRPATATQLPSVQGRALVKTERLNVRTGPGIRADNPPAEQLHAGAIVSIYETIREGNSTWHRIGPDSWVLGDWLHPLPGERDAAAPQPTGLPVGWVIAPSLNVRIRPGIAEDNPPIDQVPRYTLLPILASQMLGSTPWHCIGQGRWLEGTWIAVARALARPRDIASGDRWVSISQASQTVIAYEGETPVYAALVASGLPATPTPTGVFHTGRRSPSGRITGSNPALGGSYDLEDVPWIVYFHGGYALVGAYWHDGFGRPHSHGCVNLSPYDAWWLYRWTGEEKLAIYIY